MAIISDTWSCLKQYVDVLSRHSVYYSRSRAVHYLYHIQNTLQRYTLSFCILNYNLRTQAFTCLVYNCVIYPWYTIIVTVEENSLSQIATPVCSHPGINNHYCAMCIYVSRL